MCGIAGIVSSNELNHEKIYNMIESICYRGPDGQGFYIGDSIAIGNARLSIIDLEHGNQPQENEDGNIVIVYNGEIYNYVELANYLMCNGHRIENRSDGSVLPHMYEEYGEGMFTRLNGQFAIAIWDKKNRKLVIGRDRMGEKPLYYYCKNNMFCFASEIKALFISGFVTPKISPVSLRHLFIFQSPLESNSVFEDIYSLSPGYQLSFQNGNLDRKPYWIFSYSGVTNKKDKETDDYIKDAKNKIISAVKRNIISDIPVSTFLSGGLDSSLITAITSRLTNETIDTFSISFSDSAYDESYYQELVAKHIRTNHNKILFSTNDISNILRKVVYHTEIPFFSPGAFGMHYLAELVKSRGRKVVLDGQGADELFGGYSWFRETKIMEFNKRFPYLQLQSFLYEKFNMIPAEQEAHFERNIAILFNDKSIKETYGFQLKRWIRKPLHLNLFSQDFNEQIICDKEDDFLKSIAPPDILNQWTPIQREQFLSIVTNLPNYLLSTLGDRATMASGVECRHPFLDMEVIEFARTLPDMLKIKGLKEKYILKQIAYEYLPFEVVERKKKPYKAPININELMYSKFIRDILSYEAIREFGIFDPQKTTNFLSLALNNANKSKQDIDIFIGILTTQVLYNEFIHSIAV